MPTEPMPPDQSTPISDEAVEAAAEAIAKQQGEAVQDYHYDDARAALEAAAPFMEGGAKKEFTHCPCCGSPRHNCVCFGGARTVDGRTEIYACSPKDHGRTQYGFATPPEGEEGKAE
jgi:hypothetical protein